MPCPRRGSVSAAAAPPEAQLPQHALDGGEPGVLRAAPRAWSRTGQGGAKASAPDLQPLYQQDLLKTNYNIGFDGVEDIGKQPGGIEHFCPETHCC